jgi:hypothetical protein
VRNACDSISRRRNNWIVKVIFAGCPSGCVNAGRPSEASQYSSSHSTGRSRSKLESKFNTGSQFMQNFKTTHSSSVIHEGRPVAVAINRSKYNKCLRIVRGCIRNSMTIPYQTARFHISSTGVNFGPYTLRRCAPTSRAIRKAIPIVIQTRSGVVED